MQSHARWENNTDKSVGWIGIALSFGNSQTNDRHFNSFAPFFRFSTAINVSPGKRHRVSIINSNADSFLLLTLSEIMQKGLEHLSDFQYDKRFDAFCSNYVRTIVLLQEWFFCLRYVLSLLNRWSNNDYPRRITKLIITAIFSRRYKKDGIFQSFLWKHRVWMKIQCSANGNINSMWM